MLFLAKDHSFENRLPVRAQSTLVSPIGGGNADGKGSRYKIQL